MEAHMKTLLLAVAVPAFALAAALPASFAYAVGSDSTSTGEVRENPSYQQTAPMSKDAQTPATKNPSTQKQPKKHPPTAVMDSASPPDKSTPDKSRSAKHPPTSVMDRAAPDQKSPGAEQKQ
jgi:hypothetical protein